MTRPVNGAAAAGFLSMEWEPSPLPHATRKSTLSRYRSKGKTIKLPEENKRQYLRELRARKDFFNTTQKALAIKHR